MKLDRIPPLRVETIEPISMSALAAEIECDLAEPNVDLGVSSSRGVTEDSRQVQPGDLFVALTPDRSAIRDHCEEARVRGAAVIIAGQYAKKDICRSGVVWVKNPARVLGRIASRFAGCPARHLSLVGITGTNGKTTTSYLLEAILLAALRAESASANQDQGAVPRVRRAVGVVGTSGYRYGDHSEPSIFTTPPATILQPLLARMVASGCHHVAMEVSSHSVALGRLWGSDFDLGAFSGLTPDHLDFHGTMEKYLAAKCRFFTDHLRRGATAVINIDGAESDALLETLRSRPDLQIVRVSRKSERGDIRLADLRASLDGFSARLCYKGIQVPIHSSLVGAHNSDNVLLAAAIAITLGVAIEAVVEGLAALSVVPGRLERIVVGVSKNTNGQRSMDARLSAPPLFVDFAHTEDALSHALAALRPHVRRRLIVVFGCGGNRDHTKRPKMGAVAAKGADIVIVTSDNPRNEDPQVIIDQIAAGIEAIGIPQRTQAGPADRYYRIIADRRDAIIYAVQMIRPGDTLLIAGKGHETHQIVGNQAIDFDDRIVARKALSLQGLTG